METHTNLENIYKQRYRLGGSILIALGLLTVAEFAISKFGVTWVWVFIFIALIKAFLVLRDYMHISRLFNEDENS